MRVERFFTVTVDHIPDYLGEYQVNTMITQWGYDDTVKDAVEDLKNWAKDKDYDGIIGLKLECMPDIGSGGPVISTIMHWIAYGTVVRFS